MKEHVLPGMEDDSEVVMGDKLSVAKEITQMKEDLAYLRDVFVRRLSDDKQKNAIIQKLLEGTSYTFIEPFLHDIILILDRLEKSDDDFVLSVAEELYDVIKRRGVERIRVASSFDPSLHKAVKVTQGPSHSESNSLEVVRNGYMFSGKVLRPAEVIVVQSEKNFNEEETKGG